MSQTNHSAAVLRRMRALDSDEMMLLSCQLVRYRSLAHIVPALEAPCSADDFLSSCARLLQRQVLAAVVLCLLAL